MTYYVTLLTSDSWLETSQYMLKAPKLRVSDFYLIDGLEFVSNQHFSGVRICTEVYQQSVEGLIEEVLRSGKNFVMYGEQKIDEGITDELDGHTRLIWDCTFYEDSPNLSNLYFVVDKLWYAMVENVWEGYLGQCTFWHDIYKPLLNHFEGIDVDFTDRVPSYNLYT